MSEEVKVVEVPNQNVIGVKEKGPYAKIGVLINKLYEYVNGKNAAITSGPMFICHEHSAEDAMKADKEGNAYLEVCLPIEGGEIECEGEFKFYKLEGGKMAKITHKGPYAKAGEAYNKLFKWIADNNYKIVGNMREIYLNDPTKVPEEEFLTEIYVPIGN